MRRKKIIAAVLSLCVAIGSVTVGTVNSYASASKSENTYDAGSEEEQGELKENSWRYENGVPINNNGKETYSNSVPNAWDKVNGQYINNNGEVIEGAVSKGIDVSEHNGTINWNKVKADGIDFAIIRCGYGSDQANQDDKQWLRNVSECERLGIPYGVYLYSYANSLEKAKSEAKHVLRLLANHKPAYPVYYDLEDKLVEELSKEMKGQIAKIFCDTVSAAGYKVGIYSSLDWWKNQLTDPVFNNTTWSKWVAQWNSTCSYKGAYDIWQCASDGKVDGISGNVDLNFFMNISNTDIFKVPHISYQSNVQIDGWQNPVKDGAISGTEGQSKHLESVKIQLQDQGVLSGNVEYRTHIQSIGWENSWKKNGEVSGTEGEDKRIEAIQIRLTGMISSKYDVYYRVHAQDYGWLGWTKNGESAGTSGCGKYIQAMQIKLVEKGGAAPGDTNNAYKLPSIQYTTHVQDYGWQDFVVDGTSSGTSGESKRLEGIKIQLANQKFSGGIKYSTHVQDYGWQNFVTDGQMAGTSGESKRLEAIKMELTGEMAQHYDIYYRVHAQTFGWLDWAKNGQPAGTSGYSYRLEAIQILLVEKGGQAPGATSVPYKQPDLQYSTHVQDYGWQAFVSDGQMSGTSGESKRLESIKIQLVNQSYSGGIEYSTHVQDYGWQNFVNNGNPSGTFGESKRLEAIQIRLTGEMAQHYDIYYRVHAEAFGWLGWAKNGAPSGTSGYSYRLEGIEILLKAKGEAAPGSLENAYMQK